MLKTRLSGCMPTVRIHDPFFGIERGHSSQFFFDLQKDEIMFMASYIPFGTLTGLCIHDPLLLLKDLFSIIYMI